MKGKSSPLIFFCTVGVSLSVMTCGAADPIPWAGNGHHYDFIGSGLTWHGARDAAAAMMFMGVPGHLATITSAGENDFIITNFDTGAARNFAWIGGHEPSDDGVWRWAVGPEAGMQFSSFGNPTPPFNYANWGGIEPNDNQFNEDFTMFNIGLTLSGILPGEWADATPVPSAADPVVGYVLEFETRAIPEPSSGLLLLVGIAIPVARVLGNRRRHRP